MRILAYIRILSDEATIRRVNEEAKIPDAVVAELKAKKNAGLARWWNWQTAKVVIDIENVDAGIYALLSKHRPVFKVAQKYKGAETDIYLELVTHYGKGEEPRGLYLSHATLALLCELGGALDNDVEISWG